MQPVSRIPKRRAYHEAGHVVAVSVQGNGAFSTCENPSNLVVVNASISGDTLTGIIQPANGGATLGSYTATIASNGMSVSNGTYTGQSPDCTSTGSFTFTGNSVAPLNGTYTGTLTGSEGADAVSVTVSQDGNFNVTGNGTATSNGVTLQVAITAGNNSGFSNIIGAVLQANGTASNINGTEPFTVVGHFNAAASSIQVLAFGADVETGTLTKQ